METKTITTTEVRSILEGTNGAFFSVEFIKRTTGELRKMTATLNYQSKLKGGTASYDAFEKGLLVVADTLALRKTPERAIRSIPLENVLSINAGGTLYIIKKGGN